MTAPTGLKRPNRADFHTSVRGHPQCGQSHPRWDGLTCTLDAYHTTMGTRHAATVDNWPYRW